MGSDRLTPQRVRELQLGLDRIRSLDDMVESLCSGLEGSDEKWGAAIRTLFGCNRMHAAPADNILGRAVVRGIVDHALAERARIAAGIVDLVEVRDPPRVAGFFKGLG